MTEPMRDQIRDQDRVLEALLARHEEIARTVEPLAGRTSRVWAVGHGDSFLAPLAAAGAFERLTRLPYATLPAQELSAYVASRLDAHDLVIALSMSGGVGKTIAAAEAARASGARVLAITNTPGSRITTVADATLLLGIDEPAPFLAGTVTYTGSALAMMLIAAVLGSDAAALSALTAGVRAVAEALATEERAREWAGRHSGCRVAFTLGMGPHLATAGYGALKMIEVADLTGVALETEEFFHQYHWVVRPDEPVWILYHDVASRARAAAAVAHLGELGMSVGVIGPGTFGAAVHLGVAEVAPWCAPLPAAVPLQWIAYWIARAKGLDPDRRTHLRESARFTVSRRYRG